MALEPNKVIYSMIGVSKFYDKKPVLKDIYLSYFYGAKIGVLGLNGFLVFNVLLLFGVCVCGYYFLAARSRPALLTCLTSAGANASRSSSISPRYTVKRRAFALSVRITP